MDIVLESYILFYIFIKQTVVVLVDDSLTVGGSYVFFVGFWGSSLM